MKKILATFLLAGLTLTSCSPEEIPAEPEKFQVRISFENSLKRPNFNGLVGLSHRVETFNNNINTSVRDISDLFYNIRTEDQFLMKNNEFFPVSVGQSFLISVYTPHPEGYNIRHHQNLKIEYDYNFDKKTDKTVIFKSKQEANYTNTTLVLYKDTEAIIEQTSL